jgi:ParB/RepB/Spo0J family partition protein
MCEGCAERLELELQQDLGEACPKCGRHRELCQVLPCSDSTRSQVTPVEPEPQPEPIGVVWLPVSAIDEPAATCNSRQTYPDSAIAELAASLRNQGFLQPLCVRPKGSRYEVVFGVRRLRAAVACGLREVPCTIRVADDDRAFLLNTLENLHRKQLSSAERVRAIERLAATGLGVREISRRTGFNASTISRWLRINSCASLKAALETGRLDIGRAAVLVQAPKWALPRLLEQAPKLSSAELRQQVAALNRRPSRTGAEPEDERCLRAALRCLRSVRGTQQVQLVAALRRELERLSGQRA